MTNEELVDVYDAMVIVDDLARSTTGAGRIELNNIMEHLLARYLGNGYKTGNGIY